MSLRMLERAPVLRAKVDRFCRKPERNRPGTLLGAGVGAEADCNLYGSASLPRSQDDLFDLIFGIGKA